MMPQPTPITCELIAPLLPGFVGGDLADDQLVRVNAHLRDCCTCRTDAGGYMQANKALQQAAMAEVREQDVDFDAMHAAIMQRVYEEEVAVQNAAPPMIWPNRLMCVAAAVLLCAFGFWLGTDVEPETVWGRAPTVAVGERGFHVLPYAGPQADIRPVNERRSGAASRDGLRDGMAGRGRLRTDVEDLPVVLPAVLENESALPSEPGRTRR